MLLNARKIFKWCPGLIDSWSSFFMKNFFRLSFFVDAAYLFFPLFFPLTVCILFFSLEENLFSTKIHVVGRCLHNIIRNSRQKWNFCSNRCLYLILLESIDESTSIYIDLYNEIYLTFTPLLFLQVNRIPILDLTKRKVRTGKEIKKGFFKVHEVISFWSVTLRKISAGSNFRYFGLEKRDNQDL